MTYEDLSEDKHHIVVVARCPCNTRRDAISVISFGSDNKNSVSDSMPNTSLKFILLFHLHKHALWPS